MPLEKELDLDTPIRDTAHKAVLSIVRTANLLALGGAALFDRYDLTVAQFNVLFALRRKERTVTQSELGRRLVLTRASITSVLDKLEEKGLVARIDVPGNRRIHHVELTESGLALIDRAEPLYRDRVHLATSGLSEADQHALIEMLERVREKVKTLLDTYRAGGSIDDLHEKLES